MRINPFKIIETLGAMARAVAAGAASTRPASGLAGDAATAHDAGAEARAASAPAPRRLHRSAHEQDIRNRLNKRKCELAEHQMKRADDAIRHVGKLG